MRWCVRGCSRSSRVPGRGGREGRVCVRGLLWGLVGEVCERVC